MTSRTVGELLAEAGLGRPDRAGRLLVRALRSARGPGDPPPPVRGVGEWTRLLAAEARPGAGEREARALVAALDALAAAGGDDGALAAEAARWLEVLAGRIERGRVEVRLEGWPEGVDDAARRRLLGPAATGPVGARLAAGLVRDLDGFVLAGRPLRVRAVLAEGAVLPPPPRDGRGAAFLVARARPWLPLVPRGDAELTPRAAAEAAARALVRPGDLVVDAFAGWGGDAVALARAGARVLAVERDPRRLAALAEHARRFGLADRVRPVRGDALALVPALLARHPGAALHLDPPWGGGSPATWAELLPPPFRRGAFLEALVRARAVAVKLPRSFDVRGLPPRPGGWRVLVHFGEPRRRPPPPYFAGIELLTALSGR